MLIGNCYYTNITYCTIIGSNTTQAIEMAMGADYNKITECNIIGGFAEDFSLNNTLDRNYWSDYLTKYPDAKEIGNSGIWNMPYFAASEQDNHPLINPVEIPLTDASTASNIPAFPFIAVVTNANRCGVVVNSNHCDDDKKAEDK